MYIGTEVEELSLFFVNNYPWSKRIHKTTIRYEQKQKTDSQKKKKNSHPQKIEQFFKMPKLSLQGKINIETESLPQDELLRHQCVLVMSRASCR